LLCAGFVASRSTLRERLGAPDAPPAPAAATAPPEPRTPARGRLRPRSAHLGLATAALVLVIALVGAWSALQPVRSANAMDAAAAATDAGALPRAASIAQIAHDRNPLAVEPYFQLASIERAQGRLPQAQRSLEAAIELEPANPETWRRLGDFRAAAQSDLQGALRAYQAAYFLDPKSPTSLSDVVTTTRRIAMGG
jgi:cytochrome c-type biogenesis protein CcmH/NrfG